MEASQETQPRVKIDSLERVARGERDARRRLADTLKRERKAAEAVHARAEAAEAALAEQAQEVGRLEQALSESEQYKHLIWMQLAETQAELAVRSRPLWRKLLRRPPAG
jgi:chromosome segregation ATPase